MLIFSSILATVSFLALLAVAALLLRMLDATLRWSSSTMLATLDLTAHTKKLSDWNSRFVQILRDQHEELAAMKKSQELLADAILSVPTQTRVLARERMEQAAKDRSSLTPSAPRPTEDLLELLSEETIRAMSGVAPEKRETPLESVLGKPI